MRKLKILNNFQKYFELVGAPFLGKSDRRPTV